MFRFTIRELVLLTLVVAMGVGWCVDRFNQEARLRKRDAYWERGWAMDTAGTTRLMLGRPTSRSEKRWPREPAVSP
jgi:hypothetical protein